MNARTGQGPAPRSPTLSLGLTGALSLSPISLHQPGWPQGLGKMGLVFTSLSPSAPGILPEEAMKLPLQPRCVPWH